MSTHPTDDTNTTGATDPTRGDTSTPNTPLGVGGSVPSPGGTQWHGPATATDPGIQYAFIDDREEWRRSDERTTLILDANEILVMATRFFGHGDPLEDCKLDDCPDCERGLEYTRIVLDVIDQA